MLEIRLHGRGGQGAVTAVRILAAAFAKEGKYILALPEFGSERRGAPTRAYLRIDREEIYLRSKIYEPDHLVVLDQSLVGLKGLDILGGFKKSGFVIVNAQKTSQNLKLLSGLRVAVSDANSVARKYGLGPPALPVVGTAMLGAFVKTTGLVNLESVLEAVQESDELPKKEENLRAIQELFEMTELVEIPVVKKESKKEVAPQEIKSLPLSTISLGDTLSSKTGSWRTVRPFFEEKLSPCNDACPANGNIRKWLGLLSEGKVKKAWQVLTETNPLPAVTARVCQHFCEASCNRKEFDEALSINALEKFLGDKALKRSWKVDKSENLKPQRVAVIGSGPGGLSSAYQLARKGYQVTIFEGAKVLGGMLRLGIPEHRLPKKLLQREIERNILSLGIKVEKNVQVDELTLIMISERFDAILVATGAQKSRELNIPGGLADCLLSGLEFLKDVNLGKTVELGKRVIVIGGGNTAIDAARTVKKMGSEVKIIYRRTKNEMPAIKTEIEEVEKEGIEIRELVNPVEILIKEGWAKFLKCQKMILGEADESGRRKPLPIKDSYFLMEADNFIAAIGEEVDFSLIPEDPEIRKKTFLAGDIKTKAGNVAGAIGSGKETAELIDRYLRGERVFEEKPELPVVKFEDLNLVEVLHQPRIVSQEITPQEAITEAKRCFSCGICNLCGTCWKFCPHFSILEKEGKLEIDYEYCKGCGICSQECPRAVISKELEG